MSSVDEGATPAPATPLESAVKEQRVEIGEGSRTITVLGHNFDLAKKVTVRALVDFDEANRTNNLGLMVDAAAKLIKKSDRDRFIDFILGDPDDDDDVVTIDEFVQAINGALETIGGRPLDNTPS